MSAALALGGVTSAVAAAHEAVDGLQGAPLDLATDAELLELWRELERLARRLPSVEHRLVREAEVRALPGRRGCRSMRQFLRGLLRLDPGEAHARAEGALAAGPRRALTGEPLPPAYPHVAAAQAAGAISTRHARLIVDTVERLPDALQTEHADRVEEQLVAQARRFDPRQLGKLAARTRDWLDPDGTLADADHRAQSRGLTLHRRVDGSGSVTGELTAECAEHLDVLFAALAAPRPETDAGKDTRGAAQRRHDALLDALALLERAEQLPKATGVQASVIITMSVEQYEARRGLARTGHGALVPAAEALTWAGADHRRLAVVIDRVRGITGYSSLQRCFTEPQRLAIYARDGGCTFPACEVPAQWCEVHHLTDYADGGPTSVDDAALVCRHDHRHRIAEGWQAKLIDGRVAWIPPPWIDRGQAPRFNELHHPG